ncbi:hypothetical protein ACQY0O_005795 [Thecaphora frezii]
MENGPVTGATVSRDLTGRVREDGRWIAKPSATVPRPPSDRIDLKIDTACGLRSEVTGQPVKPSRFFVRRPGSTDIREVVHFTVSVSAHVADHLGAISELPQHQVPLIQFGPARERGPRCDVYPKALVLGGELAQDPTSSERVQERNGHIAAFRRIQIRSATLNNGQKGHSGQQYFALKLTLRAHLAPVTRTEASAARRARCNVEPATNDAVEVAYTLSQPITVRGRSKMHYTPLSEQQRAHATGSTGTDLSIAGLSLSKADHRSRGGRVTAARAYPGNGASRASENAEGRAQAASAPSRAGGPSPASTSCDRNRDYTSSSSDDDDHGGGSSDCSELSFDDDFELRTSPLMKRPNRASVMDIRNVI